MFHDRFHRIEDFWENESFVAWVLGNDPDATALWESWTPRNEEEAALMQEARNLLLAVQVRQHPVAAEHIKNKVAAIVNALPDQSSPLKKRSLSWNMAAAVAGIMALGVLSWFMFKTTQQAQQTVAAKLDSDLQEVKNRTDKPMAVWLEDSSYMELAPGSYASYSNKFGVAHRDVILEGKATFTVKQNISIPFRVNTGDIVTQVLGTTFSIDAEEDNDAISVVVQRGKVSVTRIVDLQEKAPGRPVILSPNQEARYGKTSRLLLKTLVQQPITLVQVAHSIDFVFTDTPLPEVFAKLEKIYSIKIVYDNPELSHCSLTANLNKEGFYDKLDLICKALRLNYQETDGQIIISGKGCQGS